MTAKTISVVKNGLHGTVNIPGDKSVSHRSIMFGAMNEPGKTVHITNFLESADCLSTVGVMRALGAKVEKLSEGEMVVTGVGLNGLKEPSTVLDAGNSGTTLRLMMGVLAGRPFLATFVGDDSLSRRPMGRVIAPLSKMGAQIVGREKNSRLPITVLPGDEGEKLRAITYDMPMASAQVKSAILLAGLRADGPVTVVEPYTSRDHTERLLAASGVKIEKSGTAVTVHPTERLAVPAEIAVPGDISSAAFWLVAGSIIENSELLLTGVGMNETRTGIIDVLKSMGADLTIQNQRTSGGESIADILVRSAKLKATRLTEEIIPRLIDEIPVIAVAALLAEGTTTITGAGELRVKETDRLQAVVDEFNKIAPGHIDGTEDGLVIRGVTDRSMLIPALCKSYDDHRMAMSLAVLGCVCGLSIVNADCVNISYPVFYDTLERLAK